MNTVATGRFVLSSARSDTGREILSAPRKDLPRWCRIMSVSYERGQVNPCETPWRRTRKRPVTVFMVTMVLILPGIGLLSTLALPMGK